jgi:menaquinone-9 beta-reductase
MPSTTALIIGAGPAGASLAIRLARQGREVTLVEQAEFPRQKVCGECLGPATLDMLDELGLGSRVEEAAGPEIREVAWMVGKRTVRATMPVCAESRHPYGRAIGRDCLDSILLEHARSQGVVIRQPARVLGLTGGIGAFGCILELRNGSSHKQRGGEEKNIDATVVIDAHGSWERSPGDDPRSRDTGTERERGTDLLAFKTTFRGATLPNGVLPILCLPGGYGGMIVADRERVTVACCIQRRTLQQWRSRLRGACAGDVIDQYLRVSCAGVATALSTAQRQGPWHAVGPLRPGFQRSHSKGVLRVGNAAVEAHPIIGEGICMAMQSAALLAEQFASHRRDLKSLHLADVQRAYEARCRQEFSRRLRVAQLYAQLAMRPALATTAASLMKGWPAILTAGARLAGKARRGIVAARPANA